MNPKLKIKLILFILVFFIGNVNFILAQGLSVELSKKIETQRYARIMFYNCENLFDPYNDTLKNDIEFMPEGNYHWTKSKYHKKLNNISKVITAIGAWSPPELVGLCEIENKKVLYDLIFNTPLYHFEYKIIHQESQDKRGIDVALLYQPKSYTPIKNRFIEINFPNKSWKNTRDILYSKGTLHNDDTIHLFVNHWPSRWGGQLESEDNRLHVASVVKIITDSIMADSKHANIIILGDFNDEPTDQSISKILATDNSIVDIKHSQLYNLTAISNSYPNIGTLKYRGKWSKFDQIIISGNLLDNKKLHAKTESFTIFNPNFLLEKDKTYLGYKPYRTFIGYKYNGGFSDHLPIFIDLNKR